MAWARNGTPDTLTSSGDQLNITDLTATTFNFCLWHGLATGNIDDCNLTLGRTTIDTGSNYASRFSTTGGADQTLVNQTSIILDKDNGAFDAFGHFYIINISADEKLVIHGRIKANPGAANVPQRVEGVGKWVNTSNQMDVVRVTNIGTGSFDTNSNLSALGTD